MARERIAEAEDLRRALEEIEALDPAAGEDALLLAEEERLGNAEALRAAATAAHEALQGDPSATAAYDRPDAMTLVGGARQELDGGTPARPGARGPGRPAERGVVPAGRCRG